HWPFIGSVVSFLEQQQHNHNGRKQGRRPAVPANLALPFPFSSQRTGEGQRAGPYAAFLGGAYNPIWTHFAGKATVRMSKTLAPNTIEVMEPYVGIDPDCRFPIASGDAAPADLTLDRLDRRRSLMEQFDRARASSSSSSSRKDEQAFDRHRGLALDLMNSARVRTALDVRREPRTVRDSYGMTLFGQSCLTARRLVEAGGRVVGGFLGRFWLAGRALGTP